jgi:ABC-2 type transport system permease protein
MIRRIALVAARDFIATVSRKGFLVGILLMPALGVGVSLLVPKLLANHSPQVHGELRVIDHSGQVADALRDALSPTAVTAQRDARRQKLMAETAPELARNAPLPESAPPPDLKLVSLPADSDLAAHKEALKRREDGQSEALALLVIPPDAVRPAAGRDAYGSYALYVSEKLGDNTESVVRDVLADVLVKARLQAIGLDAEAVERAQQVERPVATVVGLKGEQRAQRNFNRILPFIMGALLFVSVMLCGQALMTSLIEEKSSRVVEVLLSAVSPLELMWGKLLGQLGVGLLVMAVYIGLGVLLLLQFALFGLMDPLLIVYLFAFFLLSYLVFGALMMAIGAAVNQQADAQSLMGPVMLLLALPYAMSPFIGRNPDAPLAVVLSFLPPVNSFVMMVRLASESPPPVWQVALSILVGLGGAAVAVWFAAKVFRIGLLMHGKPPNFATLLRWARQA